MANIESTRIDELSNAVAPPGSTEGILAALWSEILDIPTPVADGDFFDLGGDSMTMVMVEFRIMEEFSIPLPAGALLQARTLRELTAFVDERVGSTSAG